MPIDLLKDLTGESEPEKAQKLQGPAASDLLPPQAQGKPLDLLEGAPVLAKPWYKANVDLPDWVDTDKWNSTVEQIEGFVKDFPRRLVYDTAAVVEGITDIVQKLPGGMAGLVGAVARGAKELIDGEHNVNDLFESMRDTQQKVSESVNNALRIYTPSQPERAREAAHALMYPFEAWPAAANSLAELIDNEPGMPALVKDQAKGAVRFAGDAISLALQAGAFKAAGTKMAGPKGAAEGIKPEALDPTFARSIAKTKLAKERVAGVQKPLERLRRMEETLKAEREGKALSPEDAAREARGKELNELFGKEREYAKEATRETGTGGAEKGVEGAKETGVHLRDTPESGAQARPSKASWPLDIPEMEPGWRNVRVGRRATPEPEPFYVSKEGTPTPEMPSDVAPVPMFRNAREAYRFGELATPEQLTRVELLREQSAAQVDHLAQLADKSAKTPLEQRKIIDRGMETAFQHEMYADVAAGAKGGYLIGDKLRSWRDIANDINAMLGKKGVVGDVGKMTPDQLQAYDRLTKDFLIVRRNARRVGKSLEDYLKGLKIDPAVAVAVEKNADALLAHAARTYGESVVKRYTEAEKAEPRKGKYASSVNLTKQDISAAGKQLEMAMAEQYPKRTIGLEEARYKGAEAFSTPARAEATMRNLEKLTKGQLTGEVSVLREINAGHSKMFGDIVEQFRKGEITQEQFNSATANFNEQVFRTTSDVSSEIGRALRSMRETVTGESIPKILEKYKKLSKRQQEMVDQVSQKWQEGTLTREDLDVFQRMLPDPKWSEYLTQFWYNNILSGPATQARNVMGNTVWMTVQPVLRGLAGAIETPLALFSKKPRTRYASEVMPMLAGFKQGFSRGAVRARDMFRKGYVPGELTKWEMEMGTASTAFERSPHPFLRKMAPYVTQFSRGMHAMDVWAKAMAHDGQMRALARRAAKNKGLKGAEKLKFEEDYITNPPESARVDAGRFAEHSTFMDQPDPMTSLVLSARKVPVLGTGLRFFVMPFINTVGNLFKRGMELTPGVGLAAEGVSRAMHKGMREMPPSMTKALGSKWVEGKQYNLPDILAKQAVGTMLCWWVLNKASQGRVTGPLPDDPAEREFWYRNNIQPWSMRFGGQDAGDGFTGAEGGTWVSYRWAEPFNTPIAATVQMYDRVKKGGGKSIDTWMGVTSDMWKNVVDGPYFAGLQRLLDKYEGGSGAKKIQKTQESAARFAAGWVPYSGFMRPVARTVEVMTEGDTRVRDGNPWLEAFSQVIPGLFDKVPGKLTVYGDEAVRPGGIMRQWLPVAWTPAQIDPVEQELMAVGMYPSLPRHTIKYGNKGYEIPDDVYRDYAIDYGARLHDGFTRVIDNPSWRRYDKEQRLRVLDRVRRRVGDTARKRLRGHMVRSRMFTKDNEVE